MIDSLSPFSNPDDDLQDTSKRREILDGALKVFLAEGFAAASMNDIVRAAGVSKATLYSYFPSKEALFSEVVEELRAQRIANAFDFDHDNPDVEGELRRIGLHLARFLTRSTIISAMRVVIGVGERFPEIGRRFYEGGPERSLRRLSHYLDARVAAGQLDIPDTWLAAAQFLELSHAALAKPMFFGAQTEPPDDETIQRTVESAVRLFMAGYGRGSAAGAKRV